MKIKICLLLMAFTALISNTMTAAQVVNGTAAIKFDRSATGKIAWERIYAVGVIYPQLPYSVKAAAVLSSLKSQYQDKKVDFFGIVPRPLAEVRTFAAEHPELDFTLCADPELQELRKLLGSKSETFSLAAIFNYSGKLLWSGDPVDLAMELEIITSGKYSERDEIRLAALSSELQAVLRSGNAKMIEQAADKILKLRPQQLSAVNAKAYALEISGNFQEFEQFFQDRIKRFPQAQENYFMLIEGTFRIPELTAKAPAVARCFMKQFPADVDNINAMAWSLLNNMPTSADAFTAACEAEKLLISNHAVNPSGRILTTRSLLAYRRCDIKQALELANLAYNRSAAANDKAFVTDWIKYLQTVSKQAVKND